MTIGLWIEALASCAIEGNVWAAETLEMQTKNPTEFMRRIEQLVKEATNA